MAEILPKIRLSFTTNIYLMGLKEKVKSFHLPWLDTYGLKVLSHDPSSGVIVSVMCLFCEKFGWEVNVDEEQKRKRTFYVKYFKSPWRNDNIQKHITLQHELKFVEYKQLIPEVRNVFLPQMKPIFNPWMLPMLVWMCLWISQLLRLSLADFWLILIVMRMIWTMQSML